MVYKEGDEKIYFPGIVALLVAIAAVIGTLLYQQLKVEEVNYEEILEEETGEVMGVNPSDLQPAAAPSFSQPSAPPPSN